jgi:hypothetical protein
MTDKINYIVACYLGTRRVNTVSDPVMLVQAHLEYLQKHEVALDRVTLVLNSDEHEEERRFLDLVRKYRPYYTDLRVILRENTGLSYAAWEQAVNSCIENDEGFTHYFLMEDDYVPARPDFVEIYKDSMEEGCGYVSMAISNQKVFKGKIHAGMCVGLLRGEAAEEAYEKWGTAIRSYKSESKDQYGIKSLSAQADFLDFIDERGYFLKGIQKLGSTLFLHNVEGMLYKTVDEQEEMGCRSWFLAEYGDPDKPRIFEPVIEWSRYS